MTRNPRVTPGTDPVGATPGAGAAARDAVLALGGNLGDRLRTLQGAVDELSGTPGIEVTGVSPVYETDPVGGPEQPSYLNAVVTVRTRLSAPALLERGQAVENAFRRVRRERWGPRTLDVDVLAYEGLVQDDPVLTLPHPRAHERAFVLAPWHDLDPAAEIPGHGPVAALLEVTGTEGVRRRDDLALSVGR